MLIKPDIWNQNVQAIFSDLLLSSGFFGELLMLVCQTFTMSDLVMLLHGQHQPLSRIQPQLLQFFTQNYLSGREPTDENISVSTDPVTQK